MKISSTGLFQKTTNRIVGQLGVKDEEGQVIDTLDKLQLWSGDAPEEKSYELGRAIKLVRAQGKSAVHQSKAKVGYQIFLIVFWLT